MKIVSLASWYDDKLHPQFLSSPVTHMSMSFQLQTGKVRPKSWFVFPNVKSMCRNGNSLPDTLSSPFTFHPGAGHFN